MRISEERARGLRAPVSAKGLCLDVGRGGKMCNSRLSF